MDQIIQQLIEARKKAGLTVEDIHQRTRIPTRQLSLLEAGEFEQIGAPVYVRGFIRRYAKEVGLDPDLLFGIDASREKLPPRKPKPPRLNKPKPSLAPILRIVVVIALVGLTAFLVREAVLNFLAPTPTPPPNLPPVEEPSEEEPEDEPEDTEPADEEPEVSVELAEQAGRNFIYWVKYAGEIQLTASFSETVWYQPTIDGEQLAGAHAEAGEELKWAAESDLELLLGNAPGTVFEINGHEVVGSEVDLPGNSMHLQIILVTKDDEDNDTE